MTSGRVILVDDDADVRMALAQSLELEGHRVVSCKAFIEATDHLTPGFSGVVVTDIRMPGRDGFDLLARVQRIDPGIPVIVLTGQGDVPMAVQAMTEGAFDFLEKPCPPSRLTEAVAKGLAVRAAKLDERRRDMRRTVSPVAEDGSLATRLEMVEKLLIEDALQANGGRVAPTADALGLPRKTLYDKLKRHEIEPGQFRR